MYLHVACIGETRNAYKVWSENLLIILEWLLEKLGEKLQTGFIWFRTGAGGRFL